MHDATTERNQHTSFRLDGAEVVQLDTEGAETRFDPSSWGAFLRGSLVVHAVKIPRTFRVGGDVCRDGYLVFDGGLFAISTPTFNRDYRALALKAAA